MNTKIWRMLLFSFAGIAITVGAGTAIVIANADSGGGRQSYDAPANACLEGSVECDDIPGDDAAGNACLEGATECDDIPVDSGGASGGAAGGTCLVGTIDCVDTPESNPTIM